jgi:uncharacterized protein YqcC (DUF446 family)
VSRAELTRSLLELLDVVERELVALGMWPRLRPREELPFMSPEGYLRFVLLPRDREHLATGTTPDLDLATSTRADMEYRFGLYPEAAALLGALRDYTQGLAVFAATCPRRTGG